MTAGIPADPVPCRPAATIALIRDSAEGLEVFLQRRSASMRFAAGMYVFPGGQVDAADIVAGEQIDFHHPPEPAEPFANGRDYALRDVPSSGDGPDLAAHARAPFRALFVAALRETSEECGVVLADPAGPVDPTVLKPFAHWLTPIVERRRFDTRFFVAALPEGSRAYAATGESDAAMWVRPGQALEALRSGSMPMLPPTLSVIADLDRYSSVVEVLADTNRPPIRPILPHPFPEQAGPRWVLVDAYTGEELDPATVPGMADWGGR